MSEVNALVEPEALEQNFEACFHKPARLFSAPGRVNLIGEHTDYNEGFVLPMAVNYRTVVAAAARTDRLINVRALDLDDESKFDLDHPLPPRQKWLAYISGVALELEQRGVRLIGADLVIASDVPIGAGLSSSAALEISVGKTLLTLSHEELTPLELALTAQKAEHIYAGTKCGIMDQLTVSCARQGHALLIDCRSLYMKHIPLNLPAVSVVVCNTNVKHELASSAYNQRRAECERAVEIMRQKLSHIRSLRDVRPDELESYAAELPDPLLRRCRHVVSENRRTLDAAVALQSGDLASLGKLMVLSHRSLRDDYEVSCVELDTMVELAMDHDGVYGARMTGGGFGGCTVNLVRRADVPGFENWIYTEYPKITNIEPSIYVVEAADGVKECETGGTGNGRTGVR